MIIDDIIIQYQKSGNNKSNNETESNYRNDSETESDIEISGGNYC